MPATEDKDILLPMRKRKLADLEASMEILVEDIWTKATPIAGALRTIQTKKLYKANYKSFATYRGNTLGQTPSWAFKVHPQS